MPTDGTLLLEHMPKGKQYLVTALSVFFSFGAVLSAIVAILIVPQHSCPASSEVACNVDTENRGWQYMLMTLGAIVRIQYPAYCTISADTVYADTFNVYCPHGIFPPS